MNNSPAPAKFAGIVLAGDRGPDDPLVQATGAACKALVEIDGQPMLLRVMNTLARSASITRRILSGPKQEYLQTQAAIQDQIGSDQVQWLPPEDTPSTSAYQAMQQVEKHVPILITTADHPLLSPRIVDRFCRDSQEQALDVVVGLCEYETIRAGFPGIKKTVMRFRNGNYCGCNLFAFLTEDARRLADTWRRVESERKNPLRIIRMLGWFSVLRYLTGRLSLETALQVLSRKLGLRIGAVILTDAEAAVDVDSVADRILVQKKLSGRLPGNP